MSRQARQQSNTGVYNVIQRGVNRMLIFHEDADRRMFLDLLKSQAGEFFKVYCFCLMDNHIHLIVKTSRLSFYILRILTTLLLSFVFYFLISVVFVFLFFLSFGFFCFH